MTSAVTEKGEQMSDTLIRLSLAILVIFAVTIRRQLDRIEEKIDAMKAERRTDE